MDYLAQNPSSVPISILLVDDDTDDHYFFEVALGGVPVSSHLSCIDGEHLTDYLLKNTAPDIIFIDLNMPCKNGLQCLQELKDDPDFQSIPVVIYSTSNNKKVNDELYRIGAFYYFQKSDLITLKRKLYFILRLMEEKKLVRPPRHEFVFEDCQQISI